MKTKILMAAAVICICGCGKDSPSDPSDDENPTTPVPTPYLSLGTTNKQVSDAAGNFEVLLSANVAWTATIHDEWLSLSQLSGNTGMVLRIAYAENTSHKTRNGRISFVAKDLPTVEIIVLQSNQTFTNPLGGVPDPWILKYQNGYYLCKAHGDAINISRSDKLSVLASTQTVWNCPVDNGSIKPWNVAHVWAPELHKATDGRWYIYYTAGRPSSEAGGGYTNQRSGVLRAKTDDPTGEWEDMGMLYSGKNYTPGIVASRSNTFYAIDLHPFVLNGKMYAVWSGVASDDPGQCLYLSEMSNPYTMSSSGVKISTADQPWEKVSSSINEGPATLKKGNNLYIVYSCNGSWTKDYRLGYIVLNDTTKNPMIASNWQKSPSQVFYRCDNTADKDGVNGVGHCSFTKSPDGKEDWIVYHVKNRNDPTYASGRSTFIQRFTWKADDTPDFGTPVGWGEPVIVPSGEQE
ncbi:MAG: family 43 glycosylhydrolase [Bacteroidales bacterium]|jgi:GH43 family beta-xylosidase|nr:family 43 glycosylhydrolase [Bacteroidales bacterium]